MAKKTKTKRVHHDGRLPAFAGQLKRELYHDLVKECYPAALADLCVFGVTVLADKFGWGKELLTIYCNELILNLQALQDGEIDLYEQAQAIYEDYGILVQWDPEGQTLVFETPNKERA